jgi:hypothetical protein
MPEECGWLERIELARASLDLAPQLLVFPCFLDKTVLSALFTDEWALNYELAVVRGMYDVCRDHLINGPDDRNTPTIFTD